MSKYKDLIAEAKASQLFDEDKDLHKRLIEALELTVKALEYIEEWQPKSSTYCQGCYGETQNTASVALVRLEEG